MFIPIRLLPTGSGAVQTDPTSPVVHDGWLTAESALTRPAPEPAVVPPLQQVAATQ